MTPGHWSDTTAVEDLHTRLISTPLIPSAMPSPDAASLINSLIALEYAPQSRPCDQTRYHFVTAHQFG